MKASKSASFQVAAASCLFTCFTAVGAPPVTFEDASSQIDFLRNSMPNGGDGVGGAAWFDYNNDGLLDLYIANGKGGDNGLFHNNGDGTFTNVATTAGVANGLGNSGVVAADIDNDGFKDLFLTGDGGIGGTGDSPVKLYRNQGDGTFVDITAGSGIVGSETTLAAAFGDINNDGFLDLFITAPGRLGGNQQNLPAAQHPNQLFLNNGDLTFTDISASAGVDTALGSCIVFFTDYNNDGFIDIFAGDCNNVNFRTTPVELFRNNGNLTFTDVRNQANVGFGGFWMGFAPADFDNDGDIDLFMTNLGSGFGQPNRLYSNDGDGTYTNIAPSAGVSAGPFGWGCTAQDFDNDGYVDVFYAGSLPTSNIRNNPGKMFCNDGDGTFTDQSSSVPVNMTNWFTSGVASGDYDNDGFSDIVVVTETWGGFAGEPFLLRNQGNQNNWLTIRLRGTSSNRDAVGARLSVVAGTLRQTKEIYAGSSFASMNSQRLTFGLGGNVSTDRIEVRWPSGVVECFPNQSAGQLVEFIEGQGIGCPADLLSFNMVTGTLLSGDITDLRRSDDSVVHTRSGFGQTLVDLHNMEFVINALTTVESPSSLDISIESRVDQPTGVLQVSLRNWSTGQFDPIGTAPIGNVDDVDLFANIDASTYVDLTGAIDLSVRHLVFVPFLAFTFESFIDQIDINVQ